MFSDIVLFICIYLILNASSPPSLTGGDSGELLAAGCELGTAHPPGYPLYTLLINLWTRVLYQPRIYIQNASLQSFSFDLDFNTTVAWKVGNLSCILSSFTCLFIKAVVQNLLVDIRDDIVVSNSNSNNNIHRQVFSIAPSVTAIIFSLSPIVWEYSNVAEVFAINNFLCAFVLFCTSRVYTLVRRLKSAPDTNIPSEIYKYLYLGAFISGLCLANQHASFFLVIILIFSILIICPRRIISLSVLYALSFMFTLGISPYLYLVYSAVDVKRASWGDFTSVQGLLNHILRTEYGTFQLGAKQGSESAIERLTLSILHSSRECFYVLWPLILVGLLGVIFQSSFPMAQNSNKDKLSDKALRKGGEGKDKYADNKADKKKKKTQVVETKLNSLPSSQAPIVPFLINISFYIVVLVAYVFYQVLWHFILSNLPISVAPMAYAVHARFWMQPLMLAVILGGVGFVFIEKALFSITKLSMLMYTSSNLVYWSVDLLVIVSLVTFVCNQRWEHMNRSHTGWIMHRYGYELLSSLPQNSLLLAHSDLDLNTVRYLRECEGMRPDISHLSFQMMPYPWFTKLQAPLYPNITLVEPFEGISTNKRSQGNAYLVHTFVMKNIDNFSGVYLDMQSINDAEIGDKGHWHGLTLIPFGSLYKVSKEPIKSIKHHKHSIEKTHNLSTILTFDGSKYDQHGSSIFESYPPGSWEHAVASVINDAKYQLGIYLLTYAMEAEKKVDISNILIIVDRYLAAASLLFEVVLDARLPLNVDEKNITVTTYTNSHTHVLRSFLRSTTSEAAKESVSTAFSGVMKDVDKNCALAWNRYMKVMKVTRTVGVALREKIQEEKDSDDKRIKNKTKKALIKKDLFDLILSDEWYKEALEKSIKAIGMFISRYHDDKDVEIFSQELSRLQIELNDPTAW